ncbi:MAG TPA: ParA family protein [Candidatus Scalindua sp.]|nr:ParA family protein [Candidatus Scalindua sp.]
MSGISRLIVKTEIHKATKVLSDALTPFEGKYDYVILDTSPGFSDLSVNVFFYADEILIPVSMEVLAIEGFKDFMREINELKEYSNIEIRYITPTFVDGRVKKTEDVLEHLQKYFPDKLTPSIHYSSKLSESPAWGKTIYEFAGRERASKDYAKLAGAIT